MEWTSRRRFPAQDPLAWRDCQIWSGQGKIDPSLVFVGHDTYTPVAGLGGRVVPRDSPGVGGSLHDTESVVYGTGTARSSSADLDNTDDKSRTGPGNPLPDKLDE
jgi:hypothetical protein